MTPYAAAAALAPEADFNSSIVLTTFVLFCRIGACLMLAPGVSAAQIPVRVRLYVALATTFALAPLLLHRVPAGRLTEEPVGVLRMIAVESLVGGMIGILGRMFFLALETLAIGAASMLGFSNPFGLELETNQAMAPLATFISLAGLALVFAADLHWEILRGLSASYDAIAVGVDFDQRAALRQLADVMSASFRIALRVSSPFLIYAIAVNLTISIVNRLTPQIGVFYLATPFVAAGGLALLYFSVRPLLEAFLRAFGDWLVAG